MTLSLSFLGAADGVTGSRTLLEFGTYKCLVDCGLFQGAKPLRERNRQAFKPSPQKIDSIILTHAHLDHSGYLPRICQEGYEGPIYCTEGTADLCRILLPDAAYLEEEAARYANETGYSHHKPAVPLFTAADADMAIKRLKPMPRDTWHDLAKGISFRFLRAGHIIGASLVQIAVTEKSHTKLITFSGDVGHNRSFILRGPQEGISTDILVVESTYGDRQHPTTDVLDEFAAIYQRTIARGGVLIIPAFAVGRAQEITYMIRLLEDQGRIPIVPVILDSPMAASAMEVCLNHHEDRLLTFSGNDHDGFKPRHFEVSASPDQSMLACMRDGPLVVISASGMLSGGRVLHHLKRRLPDARNTIMFCGYQAEGTKGRFLQDAAASGEAKELRIHHQAVPIHAEITTIGHLSAHADQGELVGWISRMRPLPKTVIVNHGNQSAQEALAARIQTQFGIKALTANEQRNFSVNW